MGLILCKIDLSVGEMESSYKIKVLAFAKFQSFFWGIIGLLLGVIYSFGGLLVDTLVSMGLASPEAMETPGLSVGTILAFGALIGMPLIAIICGFAMGVVQAVIYNWVFKKYNLLKIDFLSNKGN
jgi:hypothetical protein